jgi:DNA-binding transcriptional MerR regulator
MSQQVYTIGELAEAAGVTPRTIRYYTAEGLLPPPDTRGRYAQYGAEHLVRLHAIARLKEAYLPLGAIRERLAGLSLTQVAELAEAPVLAGEPSSAAAYIASVLGHREAGTGSGGHPGSRMPQRRVAEQAAPYLPATQQGQAALDAPSSVQRFPPVLPLPMGYAEPIPVAARAEQPAAGEAPGSRWQRLAIAPGIELHVLEPVAPEAGQLVDELLAFVRQRSAEP